MAEFSPPPTYASPVEVNPITGQSAFNPVWLKWFIDIAAFVSRNSGGSTTASHNNLTGLQGGGTSERYHLTAAQHASLIAGFTGTGILVRQTSPVLITPVNQDATLVRSNVALTNGAGALAATITNSPVAGNPTKWVEINDNGTIRRIPAW